MLISNFLATFSDNLMSVFAITFGVLSMIAFVRMVIKFCKGEKISSLPVGVMKDLPSSITGINKHDDNNKID